MPEETNTTNAGGAATAAGPVGGGAGEEFHGLDVRSEMGPDKGASATAGEGGDSAAAAAAAAKPEGGGGGAEDAAALAALEGKGVDELVKGGEAKPGDSDPSWAELDPRLKSMTEIRFGIPEDATPEVRAVLEPMVAKATKEYQAQVTGLHKRLQEFDQVDRELNGLVSTLAGTEETPDAYRGLITQFAKDAEAKFGWPEGSLLGSGAGTGVVGGVAAAGVARKFADAEQQRRYDAALAAVREKGMVSDDPELQAALDAVAGGYRSEVESLKKELESLRSSVVKPVEELKGASEAARRRQELEAGAQRSAPQIVAAVKAKYLGFALSPEQVVKAIVDRREPLVLDRVYKAYEKEIEAHKAEVAARSGVRAPVVGAKVDNVQPAAWDPNTEGLGVARELREMRAGT